MSKQIVVSVGERFGRLVIVKEVEGFKRPDGRIRRIFECICDCGNKHFVRLEGMRNQGTKSCGCINIENPPHLQHGMTDTRFYKILSGMKARCNNKNDSRYGGRGIECFWKTYEDFKDDMYESYQSHIQKFGQQNTTIERVNNSGNYCKENCRWATWNEQALNTRRNVFYEFNGMRLTLRQWAEEIGISRDTLNSRVHQSKWSIEKVLTTPLLR